MLSTGLTEAELRSVAAAAEPDAFISYSRDDDDLAEAIGEGLRAAGKEVWIDREKIPYASDWRARARAGIDAAKAVIFVLTEHWLASEACRYELEHAVQAHKRLVPVRATTEMSADQLPTALRDMVWIDVVGAEARPAITTLLATLDDDLAWRDMHARLLVRAQEWESKDRDRSLLLRGIELRDAETWLTTPGQHRETATSAHSTYIVASRRAASRRLRIVLGLVGIALLVSLGLGAIAYWQRGIAVDNEHNARSREFAATATAQLADDPELALLIGVQAARAAPTIQAEEVLRAALPRVSSETKLLHPGLRVLATDKFGRLGITGGTDGLGRVWDLTSGQRLAVLRGHSSAQQTDVTQGVVAAAISPDGALAATGGAEGDVRVWKPRTGRLLYVLHEPAGGAAIFGPEVAFAGGRGEPVLITGGASGIIRSWDAATGRARAVVRLPGFEVTDLAISPDGGRIAAAALPTLEGQGLVAVCDAATLAPLARVRTSTSALAFGLRGRLLATTAPRHVRVWDPGTGRLDRELSAGRDVSAAAFSPDNRTIAVPEDDGRVGLIDLVTGRREATLRHPGTISAIDFSPDGSRVVTAGTDKTARLWDARSGRLLATLSGHRSPVWYAAFLGGSQRILTAGRDGAARIWRPAVAPVGRELRGHRAVVDNIALAPDGRQLVTVSEDGTARIWDARTGRTDASFAHGAGNGNPSGAFTPDGRKLLTWGWGAPRLWDAATGRRLTTLPGGGDGEAAFSPDGSLVVAASGLVWDVARGERAARLRPFLAGPFVGQTNERPVVLETRTDGSAVIAALPSGHVLTRLHGTFPADIVAAFGPDASILAISADRSTSLWNVRSGERIGVLPGDNSLPPDNPFDRDGKRLLTVNESGVRIWDLRLRQPIADLPHPQTLGSASFSTDGRLIITASYDGLARVWEARTGRLVTTVPGRTNQTWNEGFVPHATFGPADRTLVAATGGSTAFVYNCSVCAPLPGLLVQAAQATTRKLTADERRIFLGEG